MLYFRNMDQGNKYIFLPEPEEIDLSAKTLLENSGYKLTEDGTLTETQGIFVKTHTILDKAYLDKYPNLKFVIRAGVGLDNIDLVECEKRSIQVFNSPLSNSNSVAEYVVLLGLLLLRKFEFQRNAIKDGSWRDKEHIGSEIKGKILGLVGSGNIGKLVANNYKALGVERVLSYDPYLDKETLESFGIEKCELDEVFVKSDIVSLHLPLTDETKNLIGTKYFNLMKNGSCLINTARGGVINENELVSFLEYGGNVNFALDVFENEPNINKKLLSFNNVVVTPHIAAFTNEAQERMSFQAAQNFLEKYKKGD